MKGILKQLYYNNFLPREEIIALLDNITEHMYPMLFEMAQSTVKRVYGNRIFIRGLMEFSNHCKNNCLYCGIRRNNKEVVRYRLSKTQILDSLKKAYNLGYKTFVLQSGEDLYYTDRLLVEIIKEIKSKFPNTALTLSIGERDFDEYEQFFNAGVDRFLLRHETATPSLYNMLHPNMNFENRKNCLYNLKKIRYQTGAGFIVGLPNENNEVLADNLLFLKELNPEMIGIGPLVPHPQTPLSHMKAGSIKKTLLLLALTRLFIPRALIPITSALNTLDERGIEKGIKAGCNVLMLNLSPKSVKTKYEIYKGKEARDMYEIAAIKKKINAIGYVVDMSRGDHIDWLK
ncbi:MAG TPA: [FeFe] hydrogenase H-cluster radical SAM maturase HydE [Tepidimicrobium sp.]|nr:[FeFe] hydrogenase H-cluster radical SAM maturase HydE [Tepidimicrobium sp.]